MLCIREANYESDRAVLLKIRFRVFVDEQHVPPSLETDDRDPFCVHLLAFEDDEAIGTGRIDVDQGGKIGKRNGLSKVWCNAQVTAVPFYERLGYQAVGETFFEAGIEHVKMERQIL